MRNLRRKWRQKATPLHFDLISKAAKFKRIRISKDKALCICESDNELLIYGVALKDKQLIDNLYESIQKTSTSKHYIFKEKKRNDYESWHWTKWAKYSLKPFMSREYLDAQKEADKFFVNNKKLFRIMSAMLKQCASDIFKQFQNYSLSNEVQRLCEAWMNCVINKEENNSN